MKVFVLEVREFWEGNFGDSESSLQFKSVHKTKDSAEKELFEKYGIYPTISDHWEYQITEQEVQE